MPIKWTSGANEKLLKAILAHTDVKVDHKAVAGSMGDGVTFVAVGLQINKLKREAKASHVASHKRGAAMEGVDELVDGMPTTPTQKSKGKKSGSSVHAMRGRPKKNPIAQKAGLNMEGSVSPGEDTAAIGNSGLKLEPEEG